MGKKKDAKNEVEVAVPVAEEGTSTSIEPVTLTINDLQLLAQIVDLASQRGAFRAAELEQVGAAYTKVTGFLKYVASVQEKSAEAAPEETVSEEE